MVIAALPQMIVEGCEVKIKVCGMGFSAIKLLLLLWNARKVYTNLFDYCVV